MNNCFLIYSRLIFVTLLLSVDGAVCAFAAPPVNPPEDFVKASVVVTGPGEKLYSCAGHAFFRMQCPSENMDFCFSFESENVSDRVLSFLAGNLKMGMTAIPTEEYISSYREEGREVTEYALHLPIAVKQRLWKVLDDQVDQGMELPYDYVERGCAISVLHLLEEALGDQRLETESWSPLFEKTRREIFSSQLDHAPWTLVALNILTNGSANMDVPWKEKAITPAALVELLQNSNLKGKPVLSTVPHNLVPETKHLSAGWFSPMLVAVILFILCVVFAVKGSRVILFSLSLLQLLLGLLNVYLIFFSSLCATEWSWLIIPFNPLPAIFWKWRSHWEIPYAIIIAVWCVAMVCVPHSLTHPSLVLLALTTGFAFAADRLFPRGISLPALFGKDSTISNISKFKPAKL